VLAHIRRLLDEYGFLQGSAFDKLLKYLQDQYIEVIEEKIIKYLETVSGFLARVFRKE
jgi:hypothetical protein